MLLSDLHHMDSCLNKMLYSGFQINKDTTLQSDGMEIEEENGYDSSSDLNPRQQVEKAMDEACEEYDLDNIGQIGPDNIHTYQMHLDKKGKIYDIDIGWEVTESGDIEAFFYAVNDQDGNEEATESFAYLQECVADLMKKLQDIKSRELPTIREDDAMEDIGDGVNRLRINQRPT
jgi:hypothetical protein